MAYFIWRMGDDCAVIALYSEEREEIIAVGLAIGEVEDLEFREGSIYPGRKDRGRLRTMEREIPPRAWQVATSPRRSDALAGASG